MGTEKRKPEKVKILQITSMGYPNGCADVFGLGDDGKIYTWHFRDGCFNKNWELSKEKKDRVAKEAAQEKIDKLNKQLNATK